MYGCLPALELSVNKLTKQGKKARGGVVVTLNYTTSLKWDV